MINDIEKLVSIKQTDSLVNALLLLKMEDIKITELSINRLHLYDDVLEAETLSSLGESIILKLKQLDLLPKYDVIERMEILNDLEKLVSLELTQIDLLSTYVVIKRVEILNYLEKLISLELTQIDSLINRVHFDYLKRANNNRMMNRNIIFLVLLFIGLFSIIVIKNQTIR